MKPQFVLIFLLLFSVIMEGQDLVELSDLDDTVSETSGLIYFNNQLITHNDSGGFNGLYIIDEQTGNIVRTVEVRNANNRDWEDLAQDSEFIYIADIGNNSGDRSDLKIYKIAKESFASSNVVEADIIEFNYSDQEGLISNFQNTNFDAEALISFQDALYIFTKNWLDLKTNVYRLPKEPGSHSAERMDQIDIGGLVTGATINESQNKILLSGCGGISAFAVELRGFSQGRFSNGVVDKYNLSLPFDESFQIESVAFIDNFNYYLSSEENRLGEATLYSLTSTTLGLSDYEPITFTIFPNPATEIIQVQHVEPLKKIQIYNLLGQVLYEDSSGDDQVELDDFSRGLYVMKIFSDQGYQSKRFLKE